MVIGLLIGFITGCLISLIVTFKLAGKLMFKENLSSLEFSDLEVKLKTEVEDANWKLLGQHDLKDKMEKNGFSVLEAKVFDVCKPTLASNILKRDAERIVSPLMPCRIAIYKKSDKRTYISVMNSGLISKLLFGVIPKIMKTASKEVDEIIQPLIVK